jgi:multiple sugar transport system substrate-binding protein
MNLSKNQIIILSAVGLIILIFVLIFLGVLPGKKQNNSSSPTSFQQKIVAKISFWTYDENPQNFNSLIQSFKNQGIEITIRNFDSYESYNSALLQAMAVGQAPDIFMIPSTEIPVFANKINPLSTTQLPLVTLQNLFPQIVINDMVVKNNIYGLPLSIDTLALIYNRDLFNKAGIVSPPDNWVSFVDLVKKLTLKDENGEIVQAGTALGTTSNIHHATDILYALLLQAGSPITKNGQAVLTDNPSQMAFQFYLQFAKPTSTYYSWNANLPNSLDAFAQNKVAMIFDFQKSIAEITAKNNFINYGIAPLPQLSTSSPIWVVPARYSVFTVSRQSKNYSIAWNIIYTLTTNQNQADQYVTLTGKPPALSSLIQKYLNDPNLTVFAKQALYAKSWYGPNRTTLDQTFENALDALLNANQMEFINILNQTQSKITALINNIY